MKMISAIIKPFKLDAVREARCEGGVEGLWVVAGRGCGRRGGHTELGRGAEYQVDFIPKIKVEIATHTESAPRIVEALSEAARTGKIGDGKIFVYDLDQIVRIRTGESDEEAI
jgi:nitrogen regulatory protein P-II 2